MDANIEIGNGGQTAYIRFTCQCEGLDITFTRTTDDFWCIEEDTPELRAKLGNINYQMVKIGGSGDDVSTGLKWMKSDEELIQLIGGQPLVPASIEDAKKQGWKKWSHMQNRYIPL